jgi:hypothetical protein
VAGTDLTPVSCATVNILLSVNGGQAFDYVLATDTPNDGSQTIEVPNHETVLARIQVEAADNVFFDISDAHFSITETTGIAADVRTAAPLGFALHANNPNPFNPSTAISFDLAGSSRVTLSVYDLSGRLVATLVNGTLQAGSHTVSWGGRDSTGGQVASGVYLYQLTAGDFSQTRRMVLLK